MTHEHDSNHTDENCAGGHDHGHAVPAVTPLDKYTFGVHQMCFGCGPHNPIGLRMRFEREGEIVRSRLTLPSGYDGPPGILHGGLQSMICDEVAGWTLVGLRGRIGLTTSMNVRYIRSMLLGTEIVVEGRLVSESDEAMVVRVKIFQGGKLGCMAKISFGMPDTAKMEEILPDGVPDGWAKFFDRG